MRIWRAIPALCVLLLLISVQCRATCIAVPHAESQQAEECPLHKGKAPVKSACSHAPQWDLDDTRPMVAEAPVEAFRLPEAVVVLIQSEAAPTTRSSSQIPLTLRL